MLPLKKIQSVCADFGLNLTQTKLNMINTYCEMLLEKNKVMNLTSITDYNEIAEKHFIDSLLFYKYVDVPIGSNLIDVGTGAGFPGVVLKIARPDIDVTLLDSLNKRLIFLNEVSEAIGLDFETVHSRAELCGINPIYRENFSFATARAVAKLSVLCEYCLPFVKVGGHFICLKGPDVNDEIVNAKNSLKVLGGEISEIHEYELPSGDGRVIIDVKKISQTPSKYPRQGIKIAKKPL